MPRVVDDQLLNEVARRILTVVQPDRIILFGSAATGKFSDESDLDILVLETNPGNTRKKSVRISDALRGLGYSCDVFVMETEAFEESKTVFGGLAYPANKYGRVIYEAA
jgi:uncharacterized protein